MIRERLTKLLDSAEEIYAGTTRAKGESTVLIKVRWAQELLERVSE